jgi:histidyl-tRNA synthetase
MADILVLNLSDDLDIVQGAVKIAARCRLVEWKTEMSLVEDLSFRAQLGYAVSQNYRFAIIYSDNEHSEGMVSIKDLLNRTQNTVKLSELESYLFTLKH